MIATTLISIVVIVLVGTPSAKGFSVFPHRKAVLNPSRTVLSAPLYDGNDVEGDKAWVGGFIQENPKLNYKQLTPDLSSLELMNNTVNIDKLDRMQKVRWPEFSWTRNRGDPNSRCYLRFYDNISRIGYTKEGRIYSIICPVRIFLALFTLIS